MWRKKLNLLQKSDDTCAKELTKSATEYKNISYVT